MTDHLLKEVDDALKLHRLAQMWRKHGQQIVGIVAVAVISLIALLVWKQQQQTELQRQSDILLQSLTAAQTGEEAPDASDLTGSHAQLALLLQAKTDNAALSDAANIDNGNDLLSQYACLLASQTNSALTCSLSTAFAPLNQEFQLVQKLNAGDIAIAHQQIQTAVTPRDPMAKRRLSDLRGYVGSSLAEHLLTPAPMEATDAEPTTQK